jgi:hypothetical protein
VRIIRYIFYVARREVNVHCQFSLIVKSGGGTTPDSIFSNYALHPCLTEVICKFYVSETLSGRARQKTGYQSLLAQRFVAKYGHTSF